MKLRKRQSKLLNLSTSLAQSNWAGELQSTPVFKTAEAAAPSRTALEPGLRSRRTPDPLSSAALRAAGTVQDDSGLDLPTVERAAIEPPSLDRPVAEWPSLERRSAEREDTGRGPRPDGETRAERRTERGSTQERSTHERSAQGRSAQERSTQGRSTRERSSRERNTMAQTTAAARQQLGPARYAYVAAILAGLLWAAGMVAFVAGFQPIAPLTHPPFQAVMLAVLALAPAGFLGLAAFAVRQGARLGWETRNAHRLAEEMIRPAALASTGAGDVMERVRIEVEGAAAAAEAAHDRLKALRQALTLETDSLTEAAAEAQRTARVVADTLAQERDQVATLAQSLRATVTEISDAVLRQTQVAAEASDLARSQLNEAEATLAARAVDIAQSAAAAGAAAQEAGDHLAHQTDRLDAAAAALVERLRHLDARLAEQRLGLAEVLESCNVDQDDIAARLESRRAQLLDVIAQSRVEVAELGRLSNDSADALRTLIGTASDQVKDLAEAARAEEAALSQRAGELRAEAQAELGRHIATLEAMARETYGGAEDQADRIRRAAADHVASARIEVEQLGELAFDAGQRANKAFDARLSEAKRLIEESAALIEEVGARSATRIEQGLGATRSAVDELASAFLDIDAKMSQLPENARARAEAVRMAVDQGVGELTASAKRVVDETQSIDAAFQERVRRNYETLSEATRLMAQVATPRAPASADPSPAVSKAADVAVPTPQAPLPQAPLLQTPVLQAPVLRARATPPPPPAEDLALPARPASPSVQQRPELQRSRDPIADVAAERRAPGGLVGAQPPAERTPRREDAGLETVLAQGAPSPASAINGRARTPVSAASAQESIALASSPSTPPYQASSFQASSPQAASFQAGPPTVSAPVQPPAAPPFEPGPFRPRLKLTPTEADAALKTVFDPLQVRGREAEAARRDGERATGQPWENELDEWTWKDLLSSIEDRPRDVDALADQMIGEIAALGVDAGALLSPARIEAITAVLGAGDASAARDAVRRLAPAAIRRLSRRVLTDGLLREQVERYVQRYRVLLGGSSEREEGVAALLACDPGRAYLLLDAAIGDLQ